jgi:coproporphyrinogen III oxidase
MEIAMNNLEAKKNDFHQYVKDLQDLITKALFAVDPKLSLEEDLWERKDHLGNPGGGGITRAFPGEVIENAGVNTSKVFGAVDPVFAERLGGTGHEMWAAGISLIIHPKNPRVPTVHANFRMIQAGERFWFGGGADLTPYYPHEEDFQYFHSIWKKALTPYGVYEDMKKECDKYFVNTHRGGEMRGVGGFFYDHYNTNDLEKDFAMVKDISSNFINSYFPIVEKRKSYIWS